MKWFNAMQKWQAAFLNPPAREVPRDLFPQKSGPLNP